MKNLLYFVFVFCVFGCGSQAEQKMQQHFSNGKLVYKNNCANCHGDAGEGLAQLIPPLQKSDYLKQNFDKLPQIITNGLQGEILVNGVPYNQPMQAITTLTKVDIGYLMSYMSKAFLQKDSIYVLK